MADLDPKGAIFVGKSTKPELLALALANRHGLVTGATGTGKTVTLQVLAEGFSRAGVSVFAADIKGDLSGVAAVGEAKEALVARAKGMGFSYEPDDFPVVFWDLFGEQGHPIRATVSEVGPLLLSRLMDLNEVQEGVLNIAFKVADEQGLLLLDMKDLRAMLGFVAEHAAELTTQYGNVSKTTIGTIQRQLLVLENQGGAKFFCEPALQLKDFLRTDRDGRGFINILAADKLMENPRLYATFLLWMLSELFQELPEIGDPEKPKLVFFFDEAHLLFTDAPKALLERIEQVVRLIRSKGVGVYFVTQNPLDVPDKVLAQLGNRVQHACAPPRATRRRWRQPKPSGQPKLDTKVISELGKGEALIHFSKAMARPRWSSADGVPAVGAHRPDNPGGAQGRHRQESREGQIRPDDRFRIRLRGIAEARPRCAAEPAAAARAGGTVDADVRRIGARRGRGSPVRQHRRDAQQCRRRPRQHFRDQPPARHAASIGQVAREVTRSVTNKVAGQIAADIGRSVGGSMGGSVGRAIVRGTLGGILRR
jgi:hypothetical protein